MSFKRLSRPAALVAVSALALSCLTATFTIPAFAADQSTPAATSSAIDASVDANAPSGLTLTAGNKTLAVKWTASSDVNVTGYTLQYSTDPAFTDHPMVLVDPDTGELTEPTPADLAENSTATLSNVTNTMTITGRTTTTTNLTGLQAATTYYVRIASNATDTKVGPYSAAVSKATFSAPGAPTQSAPTAGTKAFTAKWAAPTVTGGSAVTGYRVQYSTDATFTVDDPTLTLGLVTSTTVSGLAVGQQYYIRVAALNAVGTGDFSATQTVTTFNVPGAPTGLTVTKGAGQLTAKWVAPTTTGGSAITGYDVQYSTDPSFASLTGTVSTSSTVVTATLTKLAPATTYYVRVIAKNASGNSAYSTTSSAITAALPSVPTSVAITPTKTGAGITLTWKVPANLDGGTITGYTVQIDEDPAFGSPDSETLKGTGTTYSRTGLDYGTAYYGRVAAITAAGQGAYAAAPAGATTLLVPTPPQNVVITPQIGKLTIKWAAPASAGTSAVTGYTVAYSTSPTMAGAIKVKLSATTLSTTLDSLDGEATYYITVSATNAVGIGDASQIQSATTLGGIVAPTGTKLVANVDKTLTYTWTPVADNAKYGGNITGYQIDYSTDPTFATNVEHANVAGRTTAKWTSPALTVGKTYYVRIAAVNSVGIGINSTVSNAVVREVQPITLSYQDTEFTYGANAQQLKPTITGGEAPFTYEITSGTLPKTVSFDSKNGSFTGPTGSQWNLDIEKIALGSTSACALTKQGAVYCWGGNGKGTLGNGTTVGGFEPVMAIPAGATDIAAGDGNVCAVIAGTSLQCWGTGDSLAYYTGVSSLTPTALAIPGHDGERITDISMGLSNLCVAVDGSAYCWGRVNGTQVEKSKDWITSGVTKVAVNSNGTMCAIANNDLYCWGFNFNGQTGTGGFGADDVLSPVLVPGMTGMNSVVTSNLSTCATKITGQVYCWGSSRDNTLSIGTNPANPAPPTAVVGVPATPGTIVGGANNYNPGYCATSTSGTYCWGYNGNGQTGQGSMSMSAGAQRIADQAQFLTNGGNIAVCGIFSDVAKCWGKSDNGQLGNRAYADLTTPTNVGTSVAIPNMPAKITIKVTDVNGTAKSTDITLTQSKG